MVQIIKIIKKIPLFFLALVLAGHASRAAAQDVPEGSAEAVAEFSAGMTEYINQRYTEALPHFYRAYELDSSFVVPLFFAGLCEGNLGSDVPVDSLYAIVLAERHRLSPYYIHRAEATLANANGDRLLGLEHSRKAAYLGPGTKAWYNLAYYAMFLNRPQEARTALLRLNPDEGAMKGWYGYYSVLAGANHVLGRFDEELAVARQTQERFPEGRAGLILEAQALAAMGRVDELESVFSRAGESPPTGAANTVGGIMITAAAELKAHGNARAGDQMYRDALAWYENAGEAVSSVANQTWHTLALMGAGRWRDAMAICDRNLEADPDNLWFHGAAGLIAARMGDQERVDQEKAHYIGLAPDRPPQFLPLNMGYFAAAEGRAEEAVALLERAMKQGATMTMWVHRDPAFDLIRNHPAFQEFLRPKG